MLGEFILRTIIPGVIMGMLLGKILNDKPKYWKKINPRKWEFDWTPKHVLKVGAVCSIVIVALFFVEIQIANLVETTGHQTMEENNYATQMADFSYVFFFLAITIQPIFEEWIFRGVFLEELKEKSGNKWIAVLVTGIGFGAVHLMNPGVLPLALITFSIGGIVYGLVYVYAGLGAAVFTHIGGNLFPFLLLWIIY